MAEEDEKELQVQGCPGRHVEIGERQPVGDRNIIHLIPVIAILGEEQVKNDVCECETRNDQYFRCEAESAESL
jgi:hypothetical protein